MWFQVVLMLDIGSRHLWELLLSILLKLVHFYFEVTKNFRLFQKIMKKFLRGSSSRSKEKQKEEEQKPKFNLPRTAEVRPCEWRSDDFLRRAGIYEDFYY